MKSRLLGAVGIVAVVGGIAVLTAQAPASPAFEVASVKPNKVEPGPTAPSRIVLVSGDRFDINAKMEGPSSPEQVRTMLKALLADRFKVTVHTEQRDQPIYALVLARPDGSLGPNLHVAAKDCQALLAARQSPRDDPGCANSSFGSLHIRGLPIGQLLGLRGVVGRAIVDRTGLTGNFDFDLTWAPQTPIQNSDAGGVSPAEPGGASIFTALQEQLGLKLEAQKDSQDVLVVDHVEHPTAD